MFASYLTGILGLFWRFDSSYLFYVDNSTHIITPTTHKPLVTLSANQRMQKFGKPKERYTEKQADQKMKGIQKM